MSKSLKKGISTPIAIGIILVLAVLVGGFTVWQYSEMEKEQKRQEEQEEEVVEEEPSEDKEEQKEEIGKEEIEIGEKLIEETIGSFMSNRIKGKVELYTYLPDYTETIKLKYVTLLTSFSNIVLTARDLKEYEVIKGKEVVPGKIQFTVKAKLIEGGENIGFYSEDITMEKIDGDYLITSFKQNKYNSLIEDPCKDLPSDLSIFPWIEERDVCYYRLAEETKNSEFCERINLDWGIAQEGSGRGECHSSLGVLLSDSSLCEKSNHSYRKSWCYLSIAVKEKKEEFCEKTNEKSLCYYYLALKKNDSSLCEFTEDVPGQYEEEACESPPQIGFGFLYRSSCELYFEEAEGKSFVGINGRKFVRITQIERNQEISVPLKFKIWGFYLDETNRPTSLKLIADIKDGNGKKIHGLWLDETTAGCSSVTIWGYSSFPDTEEGIIEISDSDENLLKIPIIFRETGSAG